jgi:competence protein ComEA
MKNAIKLLTSLALLALASQAQAAPPPQAAPPAPPPASAAPPPPAPLPSAMPAAASEPLDINSATAEQIDQAMVGVGKVKAAAIVADREKNGKFKSIDDLARVKGVKASIIAKNKDRIVAK